MKKILLSIVAAIMAITSVQAERIDYPGPTDEGRLSTAIYIDGDGFKAICWCYNDDMTAEYQVISYTLGKDLNIVIPNTVSKNGKTYTVTDLLGVMSNQVVSITLPAGLKKLRAHILENEPITLIDIPASVDSIGNYAFNNCQLNSLIMLNSSLKAIGDFSFCSNQLEIVNIPASVEHIGVSAFQSNNMTSLTLNEGLTEIGGAAFADNNIADVLLPSTLNSIGVGAFASNKMNEIVIPDAVTSLGERAFAYCPLTNITFGGGVKVLEPEVFLGALDSLQTLTVHDGVEEIGDETFKGCYKLAQVELPSSLKRIGNNAFYSTAIASLTTPASIGESAFENCYNLTSVTLLDGAEYVGPRAFRDDAALTEFTAGRSLKSIGESAFCGCEQMGKAYLGEQLQTIGDNAFDECKSLADVTMPETVEQIGNYAFFSAPVRELTTAANIGTGAFQNCDSLRSVIFLDGVETIGKAAFSHADSLETVVFPNTLVSIGDEAFQQNVNLRVINLPKGVKKIGKDAFYWCVQAERIILSDLDTIPDGAFAYCGSYTKKIGELQIPKSVKCIGRRTFIGLPISKLSIGEAVDSIGEEAFANNDKISSIIAYPATAPRSAKNAFDYVPTTAVVTVPCSALESYRTEWNHFTNFTGVVAIQGISEDEMKGKVTVTFSGDCASSVAVLYAEANDGFAFDHWSDGNTDNPRVITSTEPQTFIAYFKGAVTGIEQIPVPQDNARKYLINGQIYIVLPDGKTYNAQGAEMR